jgi:hypothetical protein
LILEIFKGNAFWAHFGMLCALCAFDEAVVFVGTNPNYMCAKKIKFVGVVVFEKMRFEAIVDGNAYTYERPWHKERRRNSSVLKMSFIITKNTKLQIFLV